MVYFILDEPYVKIGFSIDPEGRMKDLQLYNPRPLKLIGYIKGMIKKEQELHLRFQEHAHRNEWFHATPRLLSAISEILAEHGVVSEPAPKSTMEEHIARRLSVVADCGPRLIRKITSGQVVANNKTTRRVRSVLEQEGIVLPPVAE